MKKLYASLIVATSALPFAALAASEKLTETAQSVLKTVNVAVTIIFVFAILIFGWGIVKFIAAAGDAEKVKKAKSMIVWGVIGIAVLASLFGLVTYLQDYFGIAPSSGGGTLPIPSVLPHPTTVTP